MPLYNYHCDDCGPFEAWSSMVRSAQPCACPSCANPGDRDVAAPHLATMNPTLRKAMARSEKSGSEPQVVKKGHLAGCGCAMCKLRKTRPSVRKRWSIGH